MLRETITEDGAATFCYGEDRELKEQYVYQGYDVYFGNRIGQDLGVKINYVSTEVANRIEYLQTGKVDIILANFTVIPEWAQEVDFALVDRILFIENGEEVEESTDPKAFFASPATTRAKAFLKSFDYE